MAPPLRGHSCFWAGAHRKSHSRSGGWPVQAPLGRGFSARRPRLRRGFPRPTQRPWPERRSAVRWPS